MFSKDRLNRIIELLERDGRVSVKELSINFEVTEDSIRKDLKCLEREGYIERVYGGATLKRDLSSKAVSIRDRQYNYVEEKEEIAKKAYELIENGDIIFLDISTINLFLAQEIASGNKKVTIITNMIDILGVFTYSDNESHIISTGGDYDRVLTGFIGPETINIINKYTVSKAFIASCGINVQENKVTVSDSVDGMTKKAMLDNSRSSYIIGQVQKLSRDGVYKFASLNEFDGLITDTKPDEAKVKIIKDLGVKLI